MNQVPPMPAHVSSIPFPEKPLSLRVCCTIIENTVVKGEIARNEQYLLFPTVFSTLWRIP